MSRTRLLLLTLVALTAFSGNSLLCRMALKETAIDAATFTSVRLLAGAAMLWTIVQVRGGAPRAAGSWPSALALFAYAATLSFAYRHIDAGTGALLLFGAVQVTMIGWGWLRGERLAVLQLVGLLCAFGGLVGLLLPGLSSPPLGAALLMLASGALWGVYSLRGRGAGDPTAVSAGNFARAAMLAVLLSILTLGAFSPDWRGMAYAVLSGAVTSGVGYVIWYTAQRHLNATTAATVQLSVPVLVTLGGIVLLGEPLTLRFVTASVAVISGIALTIVGKRAAARD